MRQKLHQKHAETALDSWWDGYREMLSEGGSHRIEAFIRSRTPTAGTHSRRTRLFRTLEEATNTNRIDQYDVTLLGKRLCLCDHCRMFHDDTALLDTVERLGSWRDGEIHSTGFTERETESSITDERYSDVVPPEIALGIYVDDSLAGVFPCTAAGVTFRPEAYLDGLAAGRLAGRGD